MIITLDGAHIRPARATFSEAERMYEMLADWPAGGWTLMRCLAHVSKSAQQRTGEQFVGLVVMYCVDDPIGVARCSFLTGASTGFQVDFLSIHPDHRGAGHFTRFSDGLAYWANQVLGADEGTYQVLPSAPQVLHRSRILNGSERGDERSTEVRLNKAGTAAAVRNKRIEVTE